MDFNLVLRKFYVELSMFDFDKIFYNGKTGENILFKDVFPSCNYSVVGNSPISLEKMNGDKIDSAECVVRFNNFQQLNYENFVGKKTDVWVTGGGVQSPNHLPVCYDSDKMKKILVMNRNVSLLEKKKRITEKYKDPALFSIFHSPAILTKMINLLNGIPTTGFMIILLLSAKYRNINTFGFSFGTYKNKYHYYTDNVKQDYGHKWKNELGIFKMLVKKNIVLNEDKLKNQLKNQVQYRRIQNNGNNQKLPRHIQRLMNQRQNYKTVLENHIKQNHIKQNQTKQNKIEKNHKTKNNGKISKDTSVKLEQLKVILEIT